jgi:hypothetical protein
MQNFLLEYQSGFQKGSSGIDPLFNMKLFIEKRRELSFETRLTFLDCVVDLDKVKKTNSLK